ncbi:MAG TPA: hypothetical protein PKA90_03955 [Ignavibacteria bacterium]|nr:hypothetical protein [Ignavibacteria bacterium]HMR39563.1 hypothetical protein [Ignavibacteria bacterium]
MKIKLLFVLSVILLFVTSWTYKTDGSFYYLDNENEVCFERDVLPIFQNNCALSGCHNSESRKEGVVLDSYENIMQSKKGRAIIPYNLKRSKVFKKITEDTKEDRMPPPPNEPLTGEEISIIGKWIMEGAAETKCDTDSKETGNEKTFNEPTEQTDLSPTECDTINLTYNDIKPIIEKNCYKCHSGNSPDELFNLETYSQVKQKGDEGKLFGAINHLPGFKPMPRKSPRLSGCDLDKFNAWLNAGMRE